MRQTLANKSFVFLMFLLSLISCRITGWDLYELKNRPKKIETTSQSDYLDNSTSINTVSFHKNGGIEKETFINISRLDPRVTPDTLVMIIKAYYYHRPREVDYVLRKAHENDPGQKISYQYPSRKQVIQKTNWETNNSIVEEEWHNRRILKKTSYGENNSSSTLWEYDYDKHKNLRKATISNIHRPTDSCYAQVIHHYDYYAYDDFGNWTHRLLYQLIPIDTSNATNIKFDTLKTYQRRKITY